MNNPFDFFDKIFYINLANRLDKKLLIEEQFKKFGVNAERFEAIQITKKENEELISRGCIFYDDIRPDYAPRIKSATLSHLNLIFRAKIFEYKNILIFEDDAMFSDNIISGLDKSINDLSKINWDLFYLGCNPLKYYKETDNLGRTIAVLGSHAVAINKHFYDKILNDKFFMHYPCIDGYCGNLGRDPNVKSYMSLENLVTQRAGLSDIEGNVVDYIKLIENNYKNNIIDSPFE